jgi:hypothetical protein
MFGSSTPYAPWGWAVKFQTIPARLGTVGSRLPWTTALPYYAAVRTVAETAIFRKYAAKIWSEDEQTEFITWIAANPTAGDVIPGSGGCRKVRWAGSGRGKRGGARVIYFNAMYRTIWLLIVYTKAQFDNLPKEFLAKMKQGVENAL